ncbi:MAG: pirin family protein [Actinobacteria bacterium]|nr:pirin family protein [Actinomycetota bacterium]
MSGPVTVGDVVTAARGDGRTAGRALEVLPSRATEVGGVAVSRALPKRTRRTVGAWCFVDHFSAGPLDMKIGPHPHLGLQTVTWLVQGDVLHRDSLGSEQRIKPGQLNLMTAGRGVAHAEDSTRNATAAGLHGVQLWVALPEATRNGPPAFEHHAALPQAEHDECTTTVILGEFAGLRSPARTDTPLMGVELLARRGTSTVPLDATFEHALVVLEGVATVEERAVAPGALAYLGTGRDELVVTIAGTGRTRMLVLGGEPFPESILMWWNFVARTSTEVDEARDDWQAATERFGSVRTRLARVDAPPRQ